MRNLMLGLVLALTMAFGLSTTAFAAPTPWVHPGTHPYEGTPQEAGALHEKVIGLPVSEFMKGVALFNAGQCEEVFLPDGTVLQNTFTKAGKSRSVQTIVAFKDAKTGQTLAPNDPKRRAARCRIPGRTDGATVVFPYVCSNWSVQYLPPLVPVEVLTTPPAPPSTVSYRMKRTGEVVTPNPALTVGGYVTEVFVCPQDCVCEGGRIISTPRITTGGFSTTSGSFED